ncbi:hypothetical protein SAMN05444266_10160 [Chitinophaga jiangningensis]|uniref:Copper-binding protein MbnP-like domain-containing protein n=1 Tax=Chitinophaga jiangningensis TaxID=1419482 RepID=A0A1M6V455_9BACT|nr:MbnP family protein [Chitinophaga jiangningensis]SHK76282.1 hypothetical protein SAMN05444266_10160 [Chitinophaga jiangningensis]
MILRIFRSRTFTILSFSGILSLMACSKSENNQTIVPPATYSSLQLSFSNYVGNVPLQRNAGTYTNAARETYTISKFLYYISNFQLVDSSGKVTTLPPRYFLVDDAIDSTKKIILDSVPVGRYTAIRWLIGVDSIRNVSGVQAGALAPENGMFWTWNSGYIMAKLEGNSPAAPTALKEFQLHIGGFKFPYNALKTVTLNLPVTAIVAKGTQPKLSFRADAGKWLDAPNAISFATTTIVMAAGTDALKIAENYQQMFTVMTVAN